MIRVVIADDQALVRAGFHQILAAEPDILVLLDIRMPRMDGIEAARQILALEQPTRALMLTTFGSDDYVYAALEAGASGFLLKDAGAQQLVDAVRVIARGDALLAPAVTRLLIERSLQVRRRPEALSSPGLERLTDREEEVLEQIARGLSNAEIAAALHVSEATAKTHVAQILSKLGVRSRVLAVIRA